MTRADAIRGMAFARIGLGGLLLVAPRRATAPWLGPPTPAVQVAGRALGVRDAILGAMVLHVADHPQVAPRWLATCAVADAVDAAAIFAAREHLPGFARGVIALGVSAAVGGVALAHATRQAATRAAPSA